jgi:hypothetical protein
VGGIKVCGSGGVLRGVLERIFLGKLGGEVAFDLKGLLGKWGRLTGRDLLTSKRQKFWVSLQRGHLRARSPPRFEKCLKDCAHLWHI